MTFNVEIKNIGKLADARIRFAGFTVLAGPNNTGKSFVSKILYSLFDATHANHAAGIRYKIRRNLIQNFQVPRLSDLRGEENTPSMVKVENFGEFQFSNGEIEFNIKPSWVNQLQYWSRVVYLESPVYWKLKGALEEARDYPEYHVRGDRERLTGVPGYFHDLVRALKHEYTGEMSFPDVYARLTGEDVIGGKIEISESGDWSFQESGRSYSLPVTAMGIANLGILALLIKRKVLDEGAFVFIDEPEAHLHPAWQVLMAETLFEMSRRGVHVVIATHSVDILKWLEVHVTNNPDDEARIALNRFPPDGDGPDEDFGTQMAKIKQELTQPFSDLYMQGL